MIKKFARISITLISLFFLMWFIAPFLIFRILNIGNALGVLICVYLIFRFGLHKQYNSLKEHLLTRNPTKILWRIFNILITVFAVYAMVISGLIIGFSLKAPDAGASPTAIVLGAQVKPWGASALLQQRINAAEKYLKANPNTVAVLTGGKGSDEPMSEAQCIYENLTESGISPNRFYLEDKATNTEENMRFSYKIIKDKNLNESAAIVTDSYHQFRAWLIARKQGITSDISAVNTKNKFAGIIAYPTMLLREWIAIPVELVK